MVRAADDAEMSSIGRSDLRRLVYRKCERATARGQGVDTEGPKVREEESRAATLGPLSWRSKPWWER